MSISDDHEMEFFYSILCARLRDTIFYPIGYLPQVLSMLRYCTTIHHQCVSTVNRDGVLSEEYETTAILDMRFYSILLWPTDYE